MEQIKIGSWTQHGKVSFMDRVSELIPDPLCKVGVRFFRLSELILVEKPQEDIDKEIRLKELHKEKSKLILALKLIDFKIDNL